MDQNSGKIFIPYEVFKDILTCNLVYRITSKETNLVRSTGKQEYIGFVDKLVVKATGKDYHEYLFPKDYFCFFDAPLAQILKILKEEQSGEQDIFHQQDSREEDKLFQDIYRYYSNIELLKDKFGITFSGNKGRCSIKVPYFCKKARIEAFDRYVACRQRAKNLNTFSYQTYKLEHEIPLNHIEESWFYEMCSGVSFVSEIVAALIQLEDIHRREVSQLNSWETNRTNIFIQLLHEYRSLVEFPAVYWRSAAIRRVFFKIDKKCWEQVSKHNQLNMRFYEDRLDRLPKDSPLGTLPETKNWYLFAKRNFLYLLADEFCDIGIPTSEFVESMVWKVLSPPSASDDVWGNVSENMIPQNLNLEMYFSCSMAEPLFSEDNVWDTPKGWEERRQKIAECLNGITISENPLDWPTPRIPYQHYCNISRLSKENMVTGKESVKNQQLYDPPLSRQDDSHSRVVELFEKVHHALYTEGYFDFQA